jgi:hypothetical protein
MRTCWFIPVVLGLVLSGSASAQKKDKIAESAYFPLKDGTRWVYKAEDRIITVRVTKHEMVASVNCARLEASAGDEVHVEHLAVRPDGIYKYRADGKDIEPPLCLLKLPPRAGTTWKVESKIAGLAITGSFTLGEEKVSFLDRTETAMTVTSKDFAIAGRPMPLTYWFVRGVGPVQQRIILSGTEVVLQLQRFTATK